MKIDYNYHYRKWHQDSPEHVANLCNYYQSLLHPHLPNRKDSAILDIGCGMGYCLNALRQAGHTNLTGIDVDAGQIESCRKKGLKVQLVEDSVAFLNDRKNTFDLIVALDVIEHIPVDSQMAFIRAIGSSVRLGGKLVCTVPNANSIVAGRYRHIDWTHTCSFTEHSLDFLLHHGGFASIVIEELEKIPKAPKYWWLPVGGSRHWWALRFFRMWRRMQLMAEIGPGPGKQVPLSPNLFAVASMSEA